MQRRISLVAMILIIALCTVVSVQVFATADLVWQPIDAVPEIIVGEREVIDIGVFEDGTQMSAEKTSTMHVSVEDPTVAEVSLEHTGDGALIDFLSYAANADKKKPKEASLEEDGFSINSELTTDRIYGWPDQFFKWETYGLYVLMNSVGNQLAIDVEVPQDGYYTLGVRGNQGKTGLSAELYVHDGNDSTLMGTYSFYRNGEDASGEEAILGNVYLKKGVATVIVKKSGDKNYLMLSKLELIPVGETVRLHVTGKTIGTTTVELDGVVDGVEAHGSFDVTVKGVPGVVVQLREDDALSELWNGEAKSTELLLTVDGLPADATDFEALRVDADALLFEQAALRTEAEGLFLDVIPKNTGMTEITVIAEHEAYGICEFVIPVEIKGQEFLFNLQKLHGGGSSNVGTDPDDVTDWEQTTIGSDKELHASRGVYTDPWIYVGPRPSEILMWGWKEYGVAFKATSVGPVASFGIDVAASGSYDISMDSLIYDHGSILQMYLAPFDAENPYDEQYRLGDPIDSYNETQINCQNLPIATAYLEAGKYVYTLQVVGKNERSLGYQFGFQNIRLSTPKGRQFAFVADREKVMLARTETVRISPRFNGAEFSAELLENITLTNLAGEVLRAEYRVDGDALLLDVEGLSLGKARVQLTADYGAETIDTELAFEVVPAHELKSVSLEAPVTSATADEEIALSASATQFDGTVVRPGNENVVFEYVSSDAKVLSVSEDGIIRTKGMGSAEITVYVTRDDITKTARLKFTVTSDYPLVSVELRGLDGIALGSTAQYRVVGKLENGAPIPESAVIEYILVSNNDGAIELSQSGLVSGCNEGTAVIKAKVTTADGLSMETAEKTVTVYSVENEEPQSKPREIYLDMIARYHAKKPTPLNVRIDEVGWQINQELTDTAILTLPEASLRWQLYGLSITMKDSLLVLDVNVPAEGYYQVSVSGGKYAYGAYAQFFTEDAYIGEYDMNHSSGNPFGEKVTLNTVHLNAGVQQIYILRGTHTAESKNCLYLGGIRFTPVAEMPTKGEVALSATKTTLSLGESAWLLPGTQMSDGTVERIGYSAETRKRDPNNVIKSLKLSGDSIKLEDNNQIIPVKPGKTTVEMDAVIDGVPYRKTVEIMVDDQKLHSIIAVPEDSELRVGEKSALEIQALLEDGRKVDLSDVALTYTSSDESIAKVVDGVLETYKTGNVQITITAEMAGHSVETVLPVQVLPSEIVEAVIRSPYSAIKPNDDGYQLIIVGISSTNDEIDISDATVEWATTTPDLISVDATTGFLTPKAVGMATVTAKVCYAGAYYNSTLDIEVRNGKTKPTYYTEKRLAAAQKNIAEYPWAREIRDAAVDNADAFLNQKENIVDFIYNSTPSQEIPRGCLAGHRWDPNGYTCKYCLTDLRDEYSNYPWLMDPFNHPWKIQCPNCRRRFPSNDFGKFFEAGKDEHGNFSYEKALAEGSAYLTNDLYPEKGTGWAVDDSRGYKTGKTYPGPMAYYTKTHFGIDTTVMEESWTFIAYYNHYGVWNSTTNSTMRQALHTMREAYLYTRDPKYGRVGAILLDRVADLHPEMQIKPWFPYYFNSDSNVPRGKEVGCIWQNGLSFNLAQYYDAFYDMYDDPYVVKYLSGKAKELHYDEDYYVVDYFSDEYDINGFKNPDYEDPMVLKRANDKSTPSLIRQNIEENLLLEIADEIYTGNVFGNFGMSLATAAVDAVVLDTMPYTEDLLEWLMIPSDDDAIDVSGIDGDGNVQGGNLLRAVTNTVSRDGTGNEGAPGYNNLWSGQLYSLVTTLSIYDGYEGVDLFANPKFLMMYKATFPKLMLRHHTVAIGDSGSFHGKDETQITASVFMKTRDVEMGQLLYWKNGNTVEGLHDSIFDDCDELQTAVQEIIDEHGEYDFDKSTQQAAFGLTTLRGGTKIEDIRGPYDSQRYTYVYYGQTSGHGHYGKMDLGLAAFGINFAADFGYPQAADGDYRSICCDKNTVIHNTVLVDDKRQDNTSKSGFPLHFDDAGRVKLFDVRDPSAYATTTEEYRRSVMTVEVDDRNAYTVDFFRVKGGTSHVYSFHASSNTIADHSGLDSLQRQSRGTYAGADVELEGYATGGGTNGYDFLYNVHRAEYPGKEFMVDFLIDEYEGYVKGIDDYHLKMTMLSDFDLSEVALAKVEPPQRGDNPKEIQMVLARREGTDLDTLFTTVFEPYDGESYIASQESVSIKRIGGAWETEADAAKAVKITLKNGRVDYVVYATNNKVRYSVDDRFEFQGFAGVYILENETDDQPIYTYLNDGTVIGDTVGIEAYTGTVVDFQKDAVLDNYITVSVREDCDAAALIGKYIYVNNDQNENAVYEIKDAETLADGLLKLDLGMITLIRSMKDASSTGKGYLYNIAEGDTFTIPIATLYDDSPVWVKIPAQAVVVGNTLEVPLRAIAPSGADISYVLANELLGANIVGDTLYFSPNRSMVGSNHVGISAKNGALESTIHFAVEVYPATSSGGGGGGGSSGGDDITTEVTYTDNGDNTFTGSDGSLICAGPDKTTGTADDITDVVEKDGVRYIKNADGTLVDAGADGLLGTADDAAVATEKFVDLGNHAWAKDAIYRLVEAGVIKGVADDKFAPAAQITRADFAILLVRAWNLTADEIGTYDDVAESDYFANEVGIAAANGIVNGVGEGKFAPRAPITREQMMVMLHRTLTAQGIKIDAADEAVLASFSDAGAISGYAVDAVKLMVANGYIQGSNGKINSQGNATRAEVAVLLNRILNK